MTAKQLLEIPYAIFGKASVIAKDRLGANDKVVQRILRHAKPHVTKERYIKAFEPAVLAAMKSLETTLDTLNECSAIVQQIN